MDADPHPWDCKALGQRTPGPADGLGKPGAWVRTTCAAKHKNCKHSGCCQEAGHQCYLKQGDWALCMPSCVPGPHFDDINPDIWDCKALGGRTPGIAKITNGYKSLPGWVKEKCSKAGENCNTTMCCADNTMQCYEKDTGWATCMRGCKQGRHADDKAGGSWSCRPLGSRTPRLWGEPSLYCYSVIRLSSYEADILKHQVKTDGGIGIFGCDMADVFASDGEGWIGDGPNGPVWTHHFDNAPVGISVDGTAGNTKLFINVWKAVKSVGKYALTDWTVKVDPDCVLIAQKLRGFLLPHTGKPAYIKNCNSPTLVQQGPMMFGSVEAISQQGLNKYFDRYTTKCNGDFQWGEDRWIGACFDKIGVLGIGEWHLEGDQLCLGVGVVKGCGDGRAAYHPYKSLEAWVGCYNQAMR